MATWTKVITSANLGDITTVGALASGSIASGFTSISTSYTDAKVTSIVAGTGIDVSGATGAVTVSTEQDIDTGADVQFDSFGVGTGASGTQGEIRATNEVTAYYGSDIAMKQNIIPISNPLEKVLSIGGYSFDWKKQVLKNRGGEDGYFVRKNDVGIIAQEVEKICPEIVATRNDGNKAVRYEKLVPLLIESIKELSAKVTRLENGNSE